MTDTTTAVTRESAVLAAAETARTYQTNPTPDAFTAMLTALDTAADLGANNNDVIAALSTHA